ncbi:MAG: PocR ligand-binding domain-containing protein [Bacillota bacterium]|nr:PocR ligand-binding domain-containing protein [Bacillota bacterium]
MINKSKDSIDIDSLEIKDVIDINLLQTFQDNFAESMDIASITVDRRGNSVTESSFYTSFCNDYLHSTAIGNARCVECHRKAGEEAAKIGRTYIYTCHAGLIGFAAPIMVGGRHLGTMLGGQILMAKPEEGRYIQTAKEIGVSEEGLLQAVKKIKVTSQKNVTAAAEVLFIVANALSKIGYEELNLKKVSRDLEIEVIKKDLLLEESNKYNQLKTQLFSTISHELKTPLNIIFSSVQLMESIYDNPSLSIEKAFPKYSGIMKQNCYRLVRLIDNLIDMNKIELGFYSLELRNNNIVKIVEDITLSIVEYAKQKDISIIFDTEMEEQIIACDSEKLERIMLNLLSNSIKFTKPGGSIFVSIYSSGGYILVCVKDTGIGIPENMHKEIFDTFTQVDSSFRRNAEGSGIGLSLVKSLVEMHGGEIQVESELDKGSEFIIKLPIRLVDNNSYNEYEKEANHISGNVDKIKIEFSDIYL